MEEGRDPELVEVGEEELETVVLLALEFEMALELDGETLVVELALEDESETPGGRITTVVALAKF